MPVPGRQLLPALPLDEAMMWIGWLEFDILLGDVRSLKEKRSVVRPLVAELQQIGRASCRERVLRLV